MTLFGSRDKLLPSVCDAVRDVPDRLGVVVVVRQQRLGTLTDMNGTGVSFLLTKRRQLYRNGVLKDFFDQTTLHFMVRMLNIKVMRIGKSFGISSNFGEMYRENQYPKHEYFGIFSVSEVGQFR